jgi:hypothetical protein
MNTLATTNTYAAYEKVAAEETGGRIIKFSKDGRWTTGVEEESHDGETMLADMAGLTVGWRKVSVRRRPPCCEGVRREGCDL